MLILSALLLAAATPAITRQQGVQVRAAGPIQQRVLRYAPDPRQTLELFTRGRVRSPLIMYLHGGGWSAGTPASGSRGAQAQHFTGRGYAYATVGYRFVPGATVEQQLTDVASAIALLRRQAEVDPERVVLIGHSSGGHLAALLGTDPTYLQAARVPFAALRAVILLDPAVLDVAAAMKASNSPTIERFFRPAFGADPARHSALSPAAHTALPNAPAWLSLVDSGNMFAAAQSGDLFASLIGAGTREVSLVPVANTTHMQLNREIGAPGDKATAAVDAFLGRALPEAQRPRLR